MMKQRCYNEKQSKYRFYGGRGIIVCERWRTSFVNFLVDMGPKPEPKKKFSIERKDTYGNYEPENCRWATREEQVSNTRANVYVKYKGETKTLAQWERYLGMKPNCMSYYYKKYTLEELINNIMPKFDAKMRD